MGSASVRKVTKDNNPATCRQLKINLTLDFSEDASKRMTTGKLQSFLDQLILLAEKLPVSHDLPSPSVSGTADFSYVQLTAVVTPNGQ
ncbi:hypothetical protein [Actinomadura sp. 6N118]|uniref:hypothetical protein n=1 Tax=Actinomadura sp. 6N118 TaxID=3375151 RepID=UPI00378F57DD